MLNVEIDSAKIQGLNETVQATEKQIKLAFNRAAKATTDMMRRAAKKMMTKGLKLRSGAILKRRIIVKRENHKGLSHFRFWVGLNDLHLEDFKGRATKTGRGIRKGKAYIEGGFFMRTSNGKLIVMQRSTAARHPIDRPSVPIEDEANAIIEEIYRTANKFFLQRYRTELLGMTARNFGA